MYHASPTISKWNKKAATLGGERAVWYTLSSKTTRPFLPALLVSFLYRCSSWPHSWQNEIENPCLCNTHLQTTKEWHAAIPSPEAAPSPLKNTLQGFYNRTPVKNVDQAKKCGRPRSLNSTRWQQNRKSEACFARNLNRTRGTYAGKWKT